MSKIKLSLDVSTEFDIEYIYEKFAKATGANEAKCDELTEHFYADNKYVDATLEVVYDTETRETTKKLILSEEE